MLFKMLFRGVLCLIVRKLYSAACVYLKSLVLTASMESSFESLGGLFLGSVSTEASTATQEKPGDSWLHSLSTRVFARRTGSVVLPRYWGGRGRRSEGRDRRNRRRGAQVLRIREDEIAMYGGKEELSIHMRLQRSMEKRGNSLLFACCAIARCISFIHIACTPERTTAGAGSSSKSSGLKGIAGWILDSSYRIEIVSLGVVTVMNGVEVLRGEEVE
jgi:hypothetical protein